VDTPPQPNNTEHWRLTKDVSVADVLSLCLAAAAVLFAYTALEKRTAIIETTVKDMQSARMVEKAELLQRLDRFDDKLDRLIERLRNH
jgi:hypothetical protein